MNEAFDPYYKWLAIPLKDQPPDHYRLLGLARFEEDPQVIESAADRQMAHVRTFQSGRYSSQSQQVLNEIASARVCLLNAGKKSAYDAALRSRLAAAMPVLPAATPIAEMPIAQALPVPAPQSPRQPAVLVRPQSSPRAAASRRPSKPRWQHPVVLSGSITGILLIVSLYFVWNRTSDRPTSVNQPVVVSPAASNEPPESSPPVDSSRVHSSPSTTAPGEAASTAAVETPAAQPTVHVIAPTAEASQQESTPPLSAGSPLDLIQPGPAPKAAGRVPPPAASRNKPSVPAETALQVAESRFQEEFQQQVATATKPADELALAKTLAARGRALTDDLPGRYVALEHARELAVKSGDIPLSLEVLQFTAKSFEGDFLPEWSNVISRLNQSNRTPDARPQLVAQGLAIVGVAVDAGDWDEAVKLAGLAVAAASKTADTALRKSTRDHSEAVKELQSQYVAARQAADGAAPRPDDAIACTIRGMYRCFVVRDWDVGLPLLVQGTSTELKAVAQRELTPVKSPASKKEIADEWWKLAQAGSDYEKKSQSLRAQHWYRQAVTDLTGVEKLSVESRLAELANLEVAVPVAVAKPAAAATSLPDEGTGFIGRLSASGSAAGLMVHYPAGAVIREQAIKDLLAKNNLRGKEFRLELMGGVSVTEDTYLWVTPAGGPGATGTFQFLVDRVEQRLSNTNGNGNPMYQVPLKAGEHVLQWVVAGATLADCSLDVRGVSAMGGVVQNVPVAYSKDVSSKARKPKPKAEAELSGS